MQLDYAGIQIENECNDNTKSIANELLQISQNAGASASYNISKMPALHQEVIELRSKYAFTGHTLAAIDSKSIAIVIREGNA